MENLKHRFVRARCGHMTCIGMGHCFFDGMPLVSETDNEGVPIFCASCLREQERKKRKCSQTRMDEVKKARAFVLKFGFKCSHCGKTLFPFEEIGLTLYKGGFFVSFNKKTYSVVCCFCVSLIKRENGKVFDQGGMGHKGDYVMRSGSVPLFLPIKR